MAYNRIIMKRYTRSNFQMTRRQISSHSHLDVGKRHVIIVLVSLILLASASGALYNLSRPVEGQLIKPSGMTVHTAKTPQPTAKATTPQKISSDYFEILLPPAYRVQAASQSIPGLLYQQTLIKSSSFGSLVIAIAIKPLPEGGVNSDPSYTSRQQQPARYHFATQQAGGDTIHIVSDSQVASTVGFWPHAGYLATIGVSSGISNPGNDNSEQLNALKALFSAWQWR